MTSIDDAELFDDADELRAYEKFCTEQERGVERFELAEPALVCRWRMAKRQVPLINRHIRALSRRVVNGEPLTSNMLSWAKQHVEWSLAAGDYKDPNGVLMLVIDVNGDALMSVGPYEPLSDCSRAALITRAEDARAEAQVTGVAPELLGAATADGCVLLAAMPGEPLCGVATLVEQLAQTRGHVVAYALDEAEPLDAFLARAGEDATAFLISDEHGVVPATDEPAVSDSARALVKFLSEGVSKLFA